MQHMEDHPGDVTEEAEQRYAAMKEEVLRSITSHMSIII